ncbi:cell division protein [Alkalihalobacillus alcalophilus ATCC 27647 = CGMCC 1.3604]|uniref:Cell division protein DivIB n=1 Tax=Alkalihalobacillus alcalophilus ATCC 27647 = CGMCC 1.3604 TaxID=1218173 RepID=A0A094WJJ2_ALKAL|nr:FtsQ-type POTRA domain-containing protein [Alkalihalobacillus alcalophilus]KGA97011.1 cell division protein FtsQ [Alkalihalobacillus alcalophilus ATCC 27647 = CGMCC 1.3604]MED1563112.1 FtsQ-type POTRA domain-containing protein [Alkalihalobacillus alcalophilus]THG92216.1 cell division protein [Alkalihalobacillus alcalophilus ATCC 27647 = CGMCC 1.3604]
MGNDKLVTLDDRVPSLKEQRKQKANRRLLFFLLLFFLLLLLIVYMQSPLSHIRSIEVNGQYIASEEAIIEASGMNLGDHIWNINADEIQQLIERLPEVQKATVERQFPTTVLVEVEEYPRVAYLLKEDRLFPIMANGLFLTELGRHDFPSDAPIIIGLEEGELLTEFAAELALLPEQISERISQIFHDATESDPYAITLLMTDGIEVRSTVPNFAEWMAPYPSIAQEIDRTLNGVLHMKMSPYFEQFDFEEDAEVESEG